MRRAPPCAARARSRAACDTLPGGIGGRGPRRAPRPNPAGPAPPENNSLLLPFVRFRFDEVLQPQAGDLGDLTERGLDLLGSRASKPRRGVGEYRLLGVLPDAHDKREAEPFPVDGVQPVEVLILLRRQLVQAGRGLLV